MRILLLPGLDGSGMLFDKMKENFPEDIDVQVISYESLEGASYEEQALEISESIEDLDVFLVGESYSGSVVYELYKLLGGRVKGVVFLASFISKPSIFSRLAGLIPVSLLMPNFLSEKILFWLGFSLIGNSTLTKPIFVSIGKADKHKLKSRLCNIANLGKPDQVIACPVTYVRPSRDLLVSAGAVKILSGKCTHFRLVIVKSGHFVAQSSPAECATVIQDAAKMY